MAFILTRINVGEYEAWKPAFDQDAPGAREGSKGHRILRNVEDPGEVYIIVEFASQEDAEEGRKRLLASEVLERFEDKDLPKILDEAESVSR
jgi:hypothetical protein